MAREHIRQWKIGNVEVVRIVEIFELPDINDGLFQECSRERVLRHPWLVPKYATPAGSLKMNFQAFALRAGERRIMVDTCIGNDKQRQAPMFHRIQTTFLEDLAFAGFEPSSVDTVLCTHLHLDHVGWNTRLEGDMWVPTFPNARYLFNRAEWDFVVGLMGVAGAETDHVPDSLLPVYQAGLVDFVSTDQQVTSEIRLEPTPGHTPGHVSVSIFSEGRRAIITGDIMHHPIQCAEPELRTRFCNDPEQAIRTRRRFLERYQDRQAYVIGSHFCDPTGGWIVRDGAGWRFDGE